MTSLHYLAFNSRPQPIPGLGKFGTLIGYTAWAASAACLIGLIAAGAMLAISYRHGDTQHVSRLGRVAAGCLIVGSASSVIGGLIGFNLFSSTPQAIPGLGKVQTVIGYVSWVAAGLCLIGLIATGAMMAISYHRSGGGEDVGRLGGVAGGCLVVGSAATLVGALI